MGVKEIYPQYSTSLLRWSPQAPPTIIRPVGCFRPPLLLQQHTPDDPLIRTACAPPTAAHRVSSSYPFSSITSPSLCSAINSTIVRSFTYSGYTGISSSSPFQHLVYDTTPQCGRRIPASITDGVGSSRNYSPMEWDYSEKSICCSCHDLK